MKPYILLYNPPTGTSVENKPMPLNLLSICSLLDEERVSIVISQNFPEKVLDKFRPFIDNALCLGISCMTGVQITYGLALAKKIKKLKPTLPIIWGGYHVTALPDQTLKSRLVDIVVKGYGEITFSKLVEKLIAGQSYENIEGIAFQRNNEIIHTPERSIPKLDDLPPIPYHLFDVVKHFEETGTRMLHYITSRGCPHMCGFCADYVIYKRKWNALSAERVLDDLIRLKQKYNYDFVRFYDSNLFVNEKRIRKICEGVIEAKLNFKWIKCNGDAFIFRRYSHETLALMKKAGVTNVLLGVESGYEPALQCINKAANNEDNMMAVKKLHAHKISIGFSFIFGFPYDLSHDELLKEHRKELKATMKLIGEFSKKYFSSDYYLLFVFTPYPGVLLSERYAKLGFVAPESFTQWGAINLNETKSCPWISSDLLNLYSQCIKIIWFLNHRLEPIISRNIVRNIVLRHFVKLYDDVTGKIFVKRLNTGGFRLPIILMSIKKLIQTELFGFFFHKVLLTIKKRKSDQIRHENPLRER